MAARVRFARPHVRASVCPPQRTSGKTLISLLVLEFVGLRIAPTPHHGAGWIATTMEVRDDRRGGDGRRDDRGGDDRRGDRREQPTTTTATTTPPAVRRRHRRTAARARWLCRPRALPANLMPHRRHRRRRRRRRRHHDHHDHHRSHAMRLIDEHSPTAESAAHTPAR